jgi:hypothetical protein
MQSNNFNQQVMQPPTNFDIEVLSVNEAMKVLIFHLTLWFNIINFFNHYNFKLI